ncbi:hypothetical protein MBEHAL_1799 [Halarchaeum acidiphilum MH1-52-1]|uniref:Uncharacterized protein n=1 Tax=Halarchaeum acidiphilum MH1-52-1 TaxID=1261545 RepID=U3A5V1_9EURY|nr:DUF6663 family protein [Halarchaeum acidiphilum]GAD53039.1 hypothetical protein MBEHAL_1799 [Halarchaeum acidiphilum MH1-52-1]
MTPTTTGTYRVRSRSTDGDLRCVDLDDGEALDVAPAADLRPGYRFDGTLAWDDGTARVTECEVTDRTLFAYADGVANLFEAALDAWEEARRENSGVNARPTFDQGGDPNGAVYTFAEQTGERDVYAELRDGTAPLEPLLDRFRDGESGFDAPNEVFVLRPATHGFVLVYLVAEKGGVLADTVRDTYGCPRPDEP